MNVKICGLSHRADVEMVKELKPDYMGFLINFPNSVRSVDAKNIVQLTQDINIPLVFLFVNASVEEILKVVRLKKPTALQLHGDESPEFVKMLKSQIEEVEIWKALHLPVAKSNEAIENYLEKINRFIELGCEKIILDSSVKGQYGGTGVTCDWGLAAQIIKESKANIFLAGGLTAENVSVAIKQVNPFGVDVSSGVEKSKSNKDEGNVQQFIEHAKSS